MVKLQLVKLSYVGSNPIRRNRLEHGQVGKALVFGTKNHRFESYCSRCFFVAKYLTQW